MTIRRLGWPMRARGTVGTPRGSRRLGLCEPLETRHLLTAGLLISEFMADNTGGLVDEDGESSDWIEIHNTTNQPINLAGWHLTDNADDLAQWTFPSITLDAGAFLTLFASGKDRTNATGQLHTNFSLAAEGEYLALVAPTLNIEHAFAPAYPSQQPGLSYGVLFNGLPLANPGSQAEIHVPSNDTLGTGWTSPDFTIDEEAWRDVDLGIGFGLTVPGFLVKYYKATTQVSNLGTAESVISSMPPTATEVASVVNYHNTGGGAHYLNDRPFPTQTINVDVEDFVIEATSQVVIPAAGTWTFGVNSDDGFGLTIREGNTTHTVSYPEPRGAADTLQSFTFSAPGTYELRLVYYERGGGSEVELFAASGVHTAWNSTAFDLVGDVASGGLAVSTSSTGATGVGNDLRTNIDSLMRNRNASVYVRTPFLVNNLQELDSLSLSMKYNDGFVAYLNGTEVARRNAPNTLTWNSTATATRTDQQTGIADTINLTSSLPLLRQGLNILAIQGLNNSATNGSFLISPTLSGGGVITSDPQYFSTPTPGAINASSSFGIVADTRFSVDRGFYDQPFDVAISTDTVGATIRYTLDGSAPTASTGTVYSTPIRISSTTTLRAAAFKPGFQPTDIDTHTYVFVDQVVNQPATRPGYPATWGSAAADYEMDPEITGNPTYAGTLRDDLKSLPVMSVTMKVDDLFGASGIYSNSNNQGVSWERPVSLEYFDATSDEQFHINAGIRMYGGVGRDPQFKKHSFRVLFKDDYGDTKLRFPLFGDDAADRFDTIILRSNFNDGWVWGGASSQYIRDEFMGQTQLAMGETGRHGTFVHLYINGMYWGLYNPVERPDPAFSASYEGGEKENWDGINSGAATGGGSMTAWNTLMSMAPGLGGNAEYQRVQGRNLDGTDNPALESFLDIDNYIVYLLANFYGGNNDWVTHNWYAGRERGPNSEGFKSYSWDAEWTLNLNSGLQENSVNDTTTDNYLLKPYTYLRNNAEFRTRFGDLVHRHLFNGGALTPEATIARYRELAETVERAMVAESARWGDVVQASPFTLQTWAQQRDVVLNSYLPQRTGVLLGQLVAAGLYPGVTAPSFLINNTPQHGGTVQQGNQLSITAPTGTVYYTLDGSDPRALYGGISPSARVYDAAIPLTEAVQVKSRVLSGSNWSALNETIYTLDTPPPLRITEIMYNPAPANLAAGELDVDNDRYEYIELQNVGNATLNIADLRFTSGITFDFASSPVQSLAAGQRVVVVRDRIAFQSRYGSSPTIAGEFQANTALNNNGENIRLQSRLGQVYHDFTFSDGWYAQTDGEGFSLTVRDGQAALGSWATSNGWRASNSLGGSPGGQDAAVDPESIVINEVLTHTDAPNGDWVELKNVTDAPIDISGWFLSDDPSSLMKFQIPANTIVAPQGFVTFFAAQTFDNPTHAGTRVPFALSEYGDEAILSSLDMANNTLGGYRESIQFAAADQERSFGRFVNSAGYVDLVATVSNSPGADNSAPRVPQIVINEIMYHAAAPLTEAAEFIELYNAGATAMPLFDPAHPANTWSFTNGIAFDFPLNVTMAPGEYALIVPTDPATFRAERRIPETVRIFGPYAGSLENAGELLELSRPGTPDELGTVPYIVNERVRFNDRAPWPVTADGAGPSLARLTPTNWGNDPASWDSGTNTGTPGFVNLFTDGSPPSAPFRLFARRSAGGLFELTWSPAFDAQSSIGSYQIYRDGVEIGTSSTNSFADATVNFTAQRRYEVRATNGDGVPGPLSEPFLTSVSAFQDGAAPNASYAGTIDTELRQGAPTTNQGTDTLMEVDGDDAGSDLWVLLRWDLSQVPANATILGASITLNVTNSSSGTYDVFEMKRDWVEGQATWQEYRTGQAWQTAGGQGVNDRGSNPIGSINFSSTGQQTMNLNAAGLALVQEWVSGGRLNYGFIIGNTTITDGFDFESSEIPTVGNRPKLSLSFVNPSAAPPLGCQDIDRLVVEIAARGNNLSLDYDANGVVNRDDITRWLAIAGSQNLPGGRPYLPGDANLNGTVDGTDLEIWSNNRFSPVSGWCAGDFSADGVADGSDFNLWNQHKFSVANAASSATRRTSPRAAAPTQAGHLLPNGPAQQPVIERTGAIAPTQSKRQTARPTPTLDGPSTTLSSTTSVPLKRELQRQHTVLARRNGASREPDVDRPLADIADAVFAEFDTI